LYHVTDTDWKEPLVSSLDQRTWLDDELWAQVRPQPARFRVTISVAIFVAVVGAMVLSQVGFFHPRIAASYDEATARSNRLIVVLGVYDQASASVRVTGFRAAQPGARIISARLNGVFPPVPDNPAPDGTSVVPFTLHADRPQTVTVVYLLDCAKLRPPLRVNIATRTVFGNQTSAATLDTLTSGPLKQACPGIA
jgi:hypothetical protein